MTWGVRTNSLNHFGLTVEFCSPNLYESSVSYLEDSMKPVLLAVLRSRVRVGSSETFAAQIAQCLSVHSANRSSY
jgi:hypothetical protein